MYGSTRAYEPVDPCWTPGPAWVHTQRMSNLANLGMRRAATGRQKILEDIFLVMIKCPGPQKRIILDSVFSGGSALGE